MMKAKQFWMIGCIILAVLSGYLALDRALIGFNKYGGDVRSSFVTAQRDAIFKLIPELRPRLQANQIEDAAKAANLSVVKTSGTLTVIGGIEFSLAATEIRGVRSSNF